MPRARPRYQPRRRTFWQRIPFAVKVGVPLVVAVTGWFLVREWRRTHVVLEFTVAGAAVPALELTFFPEQLAFALPSPPPPIGRLEMPAGGTVTLDADLVPGRALVRYAGDGIGTGWAAVTLGETPRPIALGPAGRLSGRVGVVGGFIAFGSLRLSGVADARIVGFGAGEHGLVLCEARSDAEGRFELRGFDRNLTTLGIRVLVPGHAIAWLDWELGDPGEEPIVVLVPTQPIRGRVELPPELAAESLRLLAKGLPGVEAPLRPDGAFELDHVPANLEPRLLLYGLPPQFTHRVTKASPGQAGVRIEVVPAATIRGFVLDRNTQTALAGAEVWHAHGPAGLVAVATGPDGSFAIDRVPPGEIEISAQYRLPDPLGQQELLVGGRQLLVEAGKDQRNVIVRVE